jgi:hypothetical protein
LQVRGGHCCGGSLLLLLPLDQLLLLPLLKLLLAPPQLAPRDLFLRTWSRRGDGR